MNTIEIGPSPYIPLHINDRQGNVYHDGIYFRDFKHWSEFYDFYGKLREGVILPSKKLNPDMTKFEYAITFIKKGTEITTEFLNGYGEHGWELIPLRNKVKECSYNHANNKEYTTFIQLFFKRPKIS